jgi:hypothetical protein
VLRGDDRNIRQFVGQSRRDQIPLGIERHIRDQELIDGKVSDRRTADGMAIRRAFCDRINADVSGRAGPVLDHKSLTELVLHFLGKDTEQNVGRAAGGIRHNEAHWMTGPAWCPLRPRQRIAQRKNRRTALQ